MRSAFCLCILLVNFWIPGPIFVKLGMYTSIVASEPISTAHFMNLSHQSLCLYVYPPSIARQRLCNNVIEATNTHAEVEGIVWRVVFYAVSIVSKGNGRLVLPRTSFLIKKRRFGDWSHLGPIDRHRPLSSEIVLSIGQSWVCFIWRRRQNPVSETLFLNKSQDDG
jgi:hypothetical protein